MLPTTRILIVDDEEIVRESLSGWLEKDGYTVETRRDGPTALERLRAGAVVDPARRPEDARHGRPAVLDAARKLQPERRPSS